MHASLTDPTAALKDHLVRLLDGLELPQAATGEAPEAVPFFDVVPYDQADSDQDGHTEAPAVPYGTFGPWLSDADRMGQSCTIQLDFWTNGASSLAADVLRSVVLRRLGTGTPTAVPLEDALLADPVTGTPDAFHVTRVHLLPSPVLFEPGPEPGAGVFHVAVRLAVDTFLVGAV